MSEPSKDVLIDIFTKMSLLKQNDERMRSVIKSGRLVMPYDRVSADGFGYYLKTHAEDLSDPAIYLFREWVIRHFATETWRNAPVAEPV